MIGGLMVGLGDGKYVTTGLLPNLESFECTDNFEGEFCAEVMMINILKMGLAKKLRVLRTPKEPTVFLNSPKPAPSTADYEKFKEYRQRAKNAMEAWEIKLELI